MSEPATNRPVAPMIIVGALLWGIAAFSVGYLFGAQRQFSRLPVVDIGQEIAFDSKAVSFVDWSAAESGWRWSEGSRTLLNFRPGQLDPKRAGDLRLTVSLMRSLGRQAVTVSLNGTRLGTFANNGGSGSYPFVAPRALLRPLKKNVLRFDHPGATTPGTHDKRKLAIALRSVRLTYQ